MGHEAWLMGVGDFAYDPDDSVRAWARAAPRKAYRSPKTYLADVQGDKARVERITVDDLDVLLLRNDPAADLGTAAVGAERGLHLRPARRQPRRHRPQRSRAASPTRSTRCTSSTSPRRCGRAR